MILYHNFVAVRPRENAINASCNGTADMEQGTINTPNYPSNYDLNEHCTWRISSTQRIKLVFTFFSLESLYDKLFVYEGISTQSLIGTYTGVATGEVVESVGRDLFLEFSSDYSNTQQGFLISIQGRGFFFFYGHIGSLIRKKPWKTFDIWKVTPKR